MSIFERLVIRSLWIILKWIVYEDLSETDRGYAKKTIVEITEFYAEEENSV